jgi:tRNA pseudouridine55 synthase
VDGFLNVLKPPGMTSHDVVGRLRRLTDQQRIGHTGTLDPDVPGVLAVGLGQAVRLNEYLLDADKAYRGELTLGLATDTADATGEVTATGDASTIGADALQAVLADFVGTYDQMPPMVSAVQVKGRRLYDLARTGQEVERPVKRVTIHRLEMVAFWPGERPRALFDVVCSKGTYVRTLCEDIGRRLGVPAHMSHLIRTRSGPFRLTEATTLQELATMPVLPLLPLLAALPDLPTLTIDDQQALAVKSGIMPEWAWFHRSADDTGMPELPSFAGLVADDGRLLALVERAADGRRPYRYAKVLSHGE